MAKLNKKDVSLVKGTAVISNPEVAQDVLSSAAKAISELSDALKKLPFDKIKFDSAGSVVITDKEIVEKIEAASKSASENGAFFDIVCCNVVCCNVVCCDIIC